MRTIDDPDDVVHDGLLTSRGNVPRVRSLKEENGRVGVVRRDRRAGPRRADDTREHDVVDLIDKLASRDLNTLSLLQTLLEETNLTRAGERMGVTQSAMSAALARLRVQFGDQLLVRVGREFELTPFANELLPYVRQAVPLLRGALDADEAFVPETAARIIWITLSDYMAVALAPVLVAMRDVAPGLRFSLVSLPDSPFTDDKELRRRDFVVTAHEPGVPGLSETLFTDRYVCLLDPGNPALREGRLEWDDFVRLPLALAVGGRHHLDPVLRQLVTRGYHPHPRVTAGGCLAMPAAVAGTPLVAVVPSRFAERCASQTGLVVVDLPCADITVTHTLWWHAWHDDDAGHRWVRLRLIDGSRALAGGMLSAYVVESHR